MAEQSNSTPALRSCLKTRASGETPTRGVRFTADTKMGKDGPEMEHDRKRIKIEDELEEIIDEEERMEITREESPELPEQQETMEETMDGGFSAAVEREVQKRMAMERQKWIAKGNEIRKKKMLEEREEKQRKAQEEEDQREREQVEGIRLKQALEGAEELERRAELGLAEREEAIKKSVAVRSSEHDAIATALKEAKTRIQENKKAIETDETLIRVLKEQDLMADQRLVEEQKELACAARRVADAKKARLQATRNRDLHPVIQANRFSRACSICTNENPRERAVMNACGHITCITCAEELEPVDASSMTCPYCREHTTYTKLFEDLEQEGRKRASSGVDEEGASAKKGKQ